MLFRRMELLIDGRCPPAALFSGPYYFAEQLGFRKIIDTSFMITTMIHGQPDPEDLRRFFRALQRAQRDIDVRPDRYTHYYRERVPRPLPPAHGHPALGPGRAPRLRALHEGGLRPRPSSGSPSTGIFAEGAMGSCQYEQSIAGLAR